MCICGGITVATCLPLRAFHHLHSTWQHFTNTINSNLCRLLLVHSAHFRRYFFICVKNHQFDSIFICIQSGEMRSEHALLCPQSGINKVLSAQKSKRGCFCLSLNEIEKHLKTRKHLAKSPEGSACFVFVY